MIKYHNLVPNQELHLDAIQQLKLQALVWWAKYFQRCGVGVIVSTCNAEYLTSFIMQINIKSPSGGDITVVHPGKVETGQKLTPVGKLYPLRGRIVGYSLGLCGT